jgi:exonuclease SbcD
MRLLHTSDWHLGRSLHRADLRDAQAAFLDGLVETARSERVDAVLVAGDVYDRAVPSVDAVELCESALVRLRETGARVVLISGNHDSARRLGFGSRLVDAAGVHLRTRVRDCGTPVLLEDAAGPVAVYGIPYLEPDAVRTAWELPTRSHEAALTAAMARVGTDLASRPGSRSVYGTGTTSTSTPNARSSSTREPV